MTMDYGSAMDMGNAAISAAQGLHTQLGQIWNTKTSAQLWAMEGNTPMIGVNDTSSEVFSTSDAQDLENFAKTNGIQELSFWSLGRDKACATNGGSPRTRCSGTSQSPWQFSSIFNAITGGSTTPPPGGGATGPITSGYAGKCVDVAGASSANGAAVQLYDCNGTTAQTWTVGSDGTLPGARQVHGRHLGRHRQRHQGAALRLQRHRLAGVAEVRQHAGQPAVRQVPGRHRAQLGQRHPAADLDLRGRRQPAVDAAVLTS